MLHCCYTLSSPMCAADELDSGCRDVVYDMVIKSLTMQQTYRTTWVWHKLDLGMLSDKL